MKRAGRFSVVTVIGVLVGLAAVVGLLCCLIGGVSTLRMNDSAARNGKEDADSAAGPAADVPVCEAAIEEPSGAKPIGGVVPIRVKVRTMRAELDALVVKECENTTLHPCGWIEFSKGTPPASESMERDENTGVTTAVYKWDWDTTSAHNGNHTLRVEASFRVDGSDESVSAAAEKEVDVLNLAIVSCRPDGVAVWKGEAGARIPITVALEDDDLLNDPVVLTLKLFSAETRTGMPWTPVRAMTATDVRAASGMGALTYVFKWDGKDEAGRYVDTGTYTYDVEVSQPGDDDSAAYRGGYWSGRIYNSYLGFASAARPERGSSYGIEFDGEQDNGTPADETDDYYEYCVHLRVPKYIEPVEAIQGWIALYGPELDKLRVWRIEDLPCQTHGGRHDGLDMIQPGLQHDLLLRVPKSSMPPEGTYRFVLNIKEENTPNHRDHRNRPALNASATAARYKIECFISDNYYVVWCRGEAVDSIAKRVIDVGWKEPSEDRFNLSLRGAAIRWVRDDPHEMLLIKRGSKNTVPAVFGTGPGKIRAAVNGGFFALPSFEPVGDVGTASGWRYFYPSARGKLWAFSMDAVGGGFASAEVENSPVYSSVFQQTLEGYCHASAVVRESHRYGRGPVGLLVKDGVPQGRPPWWPPIIPGTEISVDLPLGRTAIAFSEDIGDGRRHFFLVSTVSSTWSQMAHFLSADDGLAGALQPMLGKKNGLPKTLRIERAFMLDGGTSARLAYRAKDSGGRLLKCPWDRSMNYDIRLPGDDSRRLTDIIAVEATCKDIGNRLPEGH